MTNATLITNLKTRRTAIGVELAALSTSKAGGLPNRSSSGVDVDHQGYKKSLYEELAQINKLIDELEAEDDGAFWDVTYGTG